MAVLDAWEIDYSKNGRELRLRMKLDEAIVEYQSQKTAKKQKDQKDFIASGKSAGHREVAPREFDVHSRWKPARAQKRKEGEEEERKTKTKP